MKCKLYDITNNDIIGEGELIRIESNVRNAYYSAYRIARKAYNCNKEADILIIGSEAFSILISSIPWLGLLIGNYSKHTWAKEVL